MTEWVNVRDYTNTIPGFPKRRHVVANYGLSFRVALCGLIFAIDDIVKNPSKPYEECQKCIREMTK
jgi:hypothetical protein